MQMAEYFSEHGISNALVQFQAELGECLYALCVIVLSMFRHLALLFVRIVFWQVGDVYENFMCAFLIVTASLHSSLSFSFLFPPLPLSHTHTGHLSYSAAYQKLNNWRNDMVTQRELHSPGRPPNYGEMVDNQLLAIVQDR